MTAARIARRLVRKIVKPFALMLTAHQLREAEEQAEFYQELRRSIVPMERHQRERAVQLVGRRNEIRGW